MKRFICIGYALFLTSCVLASEGLPNSKLTPGALNPEVSQENIQETICKVGWTKTIRPSSAYTNAIKHEQIVEYGYLHKDEDDYEEDHLIPLSLGGAILDRKNLWPQPKLITWSAYRKDRLERRLKYQVCVGQMKLADAQNKISKDWITAYKETFQ